MHSHLNEIISREIIAISHIVKDTAGRSVKIIREADSIKIAQRNNRSLGELFITALANNIWPYRYIRNRDTLSSEDQLKLAKSTVAVIGAGGLGGSVILMLARIGIGALVVVDPDKFDESNLNRQALANLDTIGIYKSKAAASSITSVNPSVEIKEFQTAMDYSNASEILNDVDVVVDALDNQPDRKMLRTVSQKFKIPLVHGAIAGFEGQVMSVLPEDTGSSKMFENSDGKQADRGVSADSVFGVPSMTPVFIASLQAMEVVKIILKRGNLLSGGVLYSDIELSEFNHFRFNT